MSYISSDVVTIASSTDVDSYRSVSGRSTIEIAMPGNHLAATVLAVGTTAWKPVGAVDGTVSISPNHDVIKLQSSALQNPYAVIDTAYDWQITFSLQEVDLHNWALALGYDEGSVVANALDPNTGTVLGSLADKNWDATNATTMELDSGVHNLTASNVGDIIKVESGTAGAIETFQLASVTNTTTIVIAPNGSAPAPQDFTVDDFTNKLAYHGGSTYAQSVDSVATSRLDYKAGQDAKYRAMRIVTQSAGSSSYVPGSTEAHQAIVFFKVRFQATGSIDLDRTAAQSIPVTAHALGNTVDESGALLTGVEIASRVYG